MIHVIATITAKPGQREAILAAFRANMPAVHAEQGCIEYVPTVDAGSASHTPLGPDTFIVVEKWATLADLDAHARSPHMATYRAHTQDLIASRVVHVLTEA